MLAAGSATLFAIGLVVVADQFSRRVTDLFLLLLRRFATVPLAFLFGVLRMRLARSSVADVVVALQEGTPSTRRARARRSHDPSVEVVYRLDPSRGLGGAGWVDAEGRGVPAPGAADEARASSSSSRRTCCVAAIVHDVSLADEPELVDAVTAAAGIAFHNERLQAELRAEIRLAGALADTTPGLLSNVDTEGRILKLNLATLKASGYSSEEEVRGKYFWDVFIDPEEREEMIARFRAAAPDFPPNEYENEFTNARGERLVIYWRSAPVLDEHGRVVSIVAGGLDITERRAREREAELRRGFLDAITDAMPSFLIAVDPDGSSWRTASTRRSRQAFGWDKGGDRRPQLPRPGGRASTSTATAWRSRTRPTGSCRRSASRRGCRARASPRVVAWTARPVLDPQGRNIVLVSGSDVTVRRRREEETRASEERFRAVVDSAPVAIVEVGLDDTVKLWNPAAERIFGWSPEDVIGGEAPMIPPDLRGGVRRARRRASARGSGSRATRPSAVRRDGTQVAVSISTAPVHDAQGQVISHMAVFSDISDRKRQEDELRASRARLVEAGDDARRKLERNLHDGAQQRLVALSVSLRLAESKLSTEPETSASILAGAREELTYALEDLRELARGIHPAVLTDRGLGAAVEALVARSPLPVEAEVEPVHASSGGRGCRVLRRGRGADEHRQVRAGLVRRRPHRARGRRARRDRRRRRGRGRGPSRRQRAPGARRPGGCARRVAVGGKPAGRRHGGARGDSARRGVGQPVPRRGGCAVARCAGSSDRVGAVRSTRRSSMSAPSNSSARRELDHRHSNGIDVTLSWDAVGDRLYVTVLDEAGDAFELAVGAGEAVDVFNHPYAYAARRESRLLDVPA